MRLLISLIALIVPTVSLADPPERPLSTFSGAKRVARDVIYSDHRQTLYCGCSYRHSSTASGGVIEPLECGYEVRTNEARGRQLEWEHIMPAFVFGHERTCWSEGHPSCAKSDGTPYRGRDCCTKSGVDPEFRRIEADLHNLAPSVGELNADRSNHPYGIVDGEPRQYGACDFEIGGSPRVAEPIESGRGDVARVWLYMSETYSIPLRQEELIMLEEWNSADPVDDWERLRDRRIEAVQGNRNPFVNP